MLALLWYLSSLQFYFVFPTHPTLLLFIFFTREGRSGYIFGRGLFHSRTQRANDSQLHPFGVGLRNVYYPRRPLGLRGGACSTRVFREHYEPHPEIELRCWRDVPMFTNRDITGWFVPYEARAGFSRSPKPNSLPPTFTAIFCMSTLHSRRRCPGQPRPASPYMFCYMLRRSGFTTSAAALT